MIKLPNTLSFRLTLWYVSAFVIFLGVAFFLFYLSINTILDNRIEEDLREDINEFKLLYESEGMARVQREIDREVKSDDESKVFLRLLDMHGNQLFSSDLSHWKGMTTDKTAIQQLLSTSKPVLQSQDISGQEAETRFIYGLIGPETVLHIGESTEDKVEMMELLLTMITIMFIGVIPLAAFVGWLMARKAVQGIEEISRTAANIERDQLGRRVSVKAQGDEILQLADTFNAMLDRIQELVSGMREMTDNIAHDLRSPLARIRAISEVAQSSKLTTAEHKASASDTIEECDRLLQMINATLDVAEVEAGTSAMENQKVNISELAKDACELFEPVAEEKGIALSCNLVVGCQIYGNVQNLQRMIANLLDNALKYTLPKGRVDIDLMRTNQTITVAVSDTGIGIPKSDHLRIFERFFRCDQSRSHDGCGMGLSFSQAVVRSHGGEITVASEPGFGYNIYDYASGASISTLSVSIGKGTDENWANRSEGFVFSDSSLNNQNPFTQ